MRIHCAVDIGSTSVSGCVIEKQRNGLRVVQFETQAHSGDPESRLLAIKSICGRLNLGNHKSITVNLDSPVFIRNMEFPFSDSRKIEPLIPYELDDQIPVDVDDLVLTKSLLVKKDKTHVLVLAAQKEEVARQLEVFSATGVEVTRLVHSSNRAVFFSGPHEPVTLVVDVGARNTEMAVVSKGRLHMVRHWNDGMEGIVHELAGFSSQDPAQVRLWLESSGRLSAGTAQEEEYEKIIRVGVERMLEEWRHFILVCEQKFQEPVERIVMTGAGTRFPGLVSAVASFFGVPVQVGNVPGEVAAEPKKASVVALAGLGLSHEVLNFRTGEFAPGARYSLVKEKALSVLLGLSLFFSMLTIAALFQLKRMEKEEKDLLGMVGHLSTDVLGKAVYDPVAIRRQIRQKTDRAGTGSGSNQVIPRMSAFMLLSLISENLPANAVWVTGEEEPASSPASSGDPEKEPESRDPEKKEESMVETPETPIQPITMDIQKLHIRSGKVSLGGTVKSAQEVDEIIRALRRIGCFQELSPGAIKTVGQGEDEKREFSIEITMNCF